jgi:ubiquinone/menaquinone biosynthesis C-methylase UbiE
VSAGRLYETALLGPLAEQLVDVAGIAPGMRVLDVAAGRGILTRRLAGAVGRDGEVVAVVASDDEARTLQDELDAARVGATVTVAQPAALPWKDGRFDVAVSQLGVAVARGSAPALAEMQRVSASVAVVVREQRLPTPETLDRKSVV